MTYIYKIHMSCCDGSLFIAIKPKNKECFHKIIMLS
jgi:hypothetical protein